MLKLEEAKFTDLTPLGDVLERYRGQGLFIHFMNPKKPEDMLRDGPSLNVRSPAPVPKVGINPQKSHYDPPGVYFYPIDWLLGHSRFLEGEQWATDWPHYIIADIDFSAQGLDLQEITKEEIDQLATKNGWDEQWHFFLNNDGKHYEGKTDAYTMWSLLKSLNMRSENNRVSWLRALRGMEWIRDREGIIMRAEPEQVCVINPRLIKIIERGTQSHRNSSDWNNFSHWRHFIKRVFTTLQQKHGGEFVWKNKLPKWRIADQDWQFEITWRESFSSSGLALTMQKGEINDTVTIPPKYLRDNEIVEVISHIESYLDSTQKMSTDHGFNPVIQPEEAKRILRQIVHWTNEEPVVEIRANTSFFNITLQRVHGPAKVKSLAVIGVDEKGYTVRVEIKINDQYLMYGSGSDPESLWKNVSRTAEEIIGDIIGKSIDREYADAFLGFIYVSTGFAIYEKYEDAFYNSNTSELYRQVERAFRRVGW